ncbi:MAG: nucleoside kinase [Treponema sp.]|nr:nucleoside kinase [Treponema sp.]
MNENINVTFDNGKVISVIRNSRICDIMSEFDVPTETILGAYVNNEICALTKTLLYDCEISPIVTNSLEGGKIYRRSLCLLLACAAHKIFPGKRLIVGSSIDRGYFYTFDDGKNVEPKQIEMLLTKMKNLVKQDLPIEPELVSYSQACRVLEEANLTETRKQLEFICMPAIVLDTIDGFVDMHYGPVVPSTGYLKVFDLMKYEQGFLLRYPSSTDMSKLQPFVDQPALAKVFAEYKEWGKRIGVTTVASLNEVCTEKHSMQDFVDVAETFQTKNISKIASQIAQKKSARVVLIAGPSSSGKTTTSKKLALELLAIGIKPKVISLDDYYAGIDRTPKDENGNPDFECLEALDVDLLNQNLLDMFDGKTVQLPSYDFHTSSQYFDESKKMNLKDDEILIMEGIHGLNPKLTAKIPDELKFKIYLSALTQLNLDDHARISTTDNRLIRRIVRDSRYRGRSASKTIASWESVTRGEKLHIFPYQNNADAVLNTALDYELAVLAGYAIPLLRCVKPQEKEYAVANDLLNFLFKFSHIPSSCVPPRSIIREFIGGSDFRY